MRFATGVLFLTCAFIAPGCALHSSNLTELRDFVRADSFRPPAETIYPRPTSATERLLRFAEAEYEDNPDVRSELAYYFLRYDNALLKRGLLSVDAQKGDLIGILWDKEATRNSQFRESPSNTAMREWISNNRAWFALSEESKTQLAANETELAQLQTNWRKPVSDGP
ncbi:MAG: hypothetical protein JNG88_08860 [Phycisphaerales bacterium]|nr:hypothetical protein [Phycisphaerales bacterium]